MGNSAGIIAMVYNGINSTIGYYRGKHDSANSVVAGALSGMLFKSTRGLRPMMISGGIVAGVAGVWTVSLIWNLLWISGMLMFVVAPGYKKDTILGEHHLTSQQDS